MYWNLEKQAVAIVTDFCCTGILGKWMKWKNAGPPTTTTTITTTTTTTTTTTMGLVRISSWYLNFNGSHFGLPPSEIHRMTGLRHPKSCDPLWRIRTGHTAHTCRGRFQVNVATLSKQQNVTESEERALEWIKLIPKTIGNCKGDCVWIVTCPERIRKSTSTSRILAEQRLQNDQWTDLCFMIQCRFFFFFCIGSPIDRKSISLPTTHAWLSPLLN